MAFNTIKLKKYLDIIIEKVAAGTITPGMVVELTSADTVQAHATQKGEVVPVLVALEDELQGNGIDDDYSALDPVQVWVLQPGEVFYGILADGETVVIGDKLASKGDGTLEKYVSGAGTLPNSIIGQALEAVDTAGSPAATTARIPVMAA